MPPKRKPKAKGDSNQPTTKKVKKVTEPTKKQTTRKKTPIPTFTDVPSDGDDSFEAKMEAELAQVPPFVERGLPELDRGDEDAYKAEVDALEKETKRQADACAAARKELAAAKKKAPPPVAPKAPAPPVATKKAPPPSAVPKASAPLPATKMAPASSAAKARPVSASLPNSPVRVSARIKARSGVAPSSPSFALGMLPEHKPQFADSLEEEMSRLKKANESSSHSSYNKFMVEKSRSKAKQTDAEMISRMRILCLTPCFRDDSTAKVTVLSSDTSPEAKRFHALMQSGRVMEYCFLAMHSLHEGWPNLSKLHRFGFSPYFATDMAIAEGEKGLGVAFDDSVTRVIQVNRPKSDEIDVPTQYGMLSSDAVICSELKHALEEKYKGSASADKDSIPNVTLRFACQESFRQAVDDAPTWSISQRFIEQNFDFVYLGDWVRPAHTQDGLFEHFQQYLQYISMLSVRGVRVYPPVSHVLFASDSWRWWPSLSKFCLPTILIQVPFDYAPESMVTKKDDTFPKDRFSLRLVLGSDYWRELTWDAVYEMNLKYLQRAWRKTTRSKLGENGCFDPEYLHHHGVRMDPQFPSNNVFQLIFVPPLEESDDESQDGSHVTVYAGDGLEVTEFPPMKLFGVGHLGIDQENINEENHNAEETGLSEAFVTLRYKLSIGVDVFRKKEEDKGDGLSNQKKDFESDPDGILPPAVDDDSQDEDEETEDEGIPEGNTNSRPARMIMRLGPTGSLGALMSIRYKTTMNGKSVREVHSIQRSDPSTKAAKVSATTKKNKQGVKDKDGGKGNGGKGKRKWASNSLRSYPFGKIQQAIIGSTKNSLKLIPGVLYETEWVTSDKVKTQPWYEKSDTRFILSKFSLFPAGSDFVVQAIPISKGNTVHMLKWERVAPVVEQIAFMIAKFYSDWPR